MQTCNRCKHEKEIDCFSWRIKSENKRHRICKECHKDDAHKHYMENREMYIEKAKAANPRQKEEFKEFVISYLENHPCVDCGEADLDVLEFDHVELVGSSGRRVSQCKSKKKFYAEVEKCEVRCANCHTRRTRKQLGTQRKRLI